jgi:hypothetical protein
MAPAVLVQQVRARVSEIPIDGDVIRSAGDLAERHALRGYDAIHLAALLQAGGPAHVTFACWDGDLRAPPAGSATSSFLVDGSSSPRRSPSDKRHRSMAGLCGTLLPARKCSPVDSWRVPSPMAEPERTGIQVIQVNRGY